jgi:DNA-binding transcriptional ArsR family regulator
LQLLNHRHEWDAEGRVSRPLYQLKAEFFKTLGHPARIRVLELLSQREHAVAELLPEVGVEAANLSQQLAVLRRAGLVVTRKEGSTVYYSLTSPQVAELLAVARRILTTVLSGQVELLEDLREASTAARARPQRRRTGTG